MCRAQWSGWLPSWGGNRGFTSEHPALFNNAARTAGSMLKAGFFSEACDISKRQEEAQRLTYSRAFMAGGAISHPY